MVSEIITSIAMLPNKMKVVQLKMREARFWPKMKFEPIFFQVLCQFFNPKGLLLPLRQGYEGHGAAGGKGVGGKEFLPALAFPPPPNFVPVKLAHLVKTSKQ